MHSTTKYLSGHSDVMGGVVVTREAGPLGERLRSIQSAGGAVPAPFDYWTPSLPIVAPAVRVPIGIEAASVLVH